MNIKRKPLVKMKVKRKKQTKMKKTRVVFPKKLSPLPKFPVPRFPMPRFPKPMKPIKNMTEWEKAVDLQFAKLERDLQKEFCFLEAGGVPHDTLSVINEEPSDVEEVIPEKETLPKWKGIYCLDVDRSTQTKLKCLIGRDLTIDNYWKYLDKEILLKHVDDNAEGSPFFPIARQLKDSKTNYVLIMFDGNFLYDYLFICVKPLREYKMLKFAFKVRKSIFDTSARNHIRSLKDYHSVTAPFHRFVIWRNKKRSFRNKIMLAAFIDEEERKAKEIILTSVESDQLNDGYMCFEPSEKERQRGLIRLKKFGTNKHFNKQMVPVLRDKVAQTIDSWTLTTGVQKDYLFIDKVDCRTMRKVVRLLRSCYKFLSKSINEYRRLDLYKGHIEAYKARYHWFKHHRSLIELRRQFRPVTTPSPDNWTFLRLSFKIVPEFREFESISCMTWHPRYIDLIAVAYRGYVHVGRNYPEDEIYVTNIFYKVLIPEYVILVWKLGKELRPVRIIVCQSEVRALQYNPDYQSLLAGANASGQIMLWDMNNYYHPEHYFLENMSRQFGDNHVPWTHIPPRETQVILESSEVFSHRDCIHDLQWLPSNSRVCHDGTVDISGNVKSGQLVTASEDGTVGFWSFQSQHPIVRGIQKRRHYASKVCPDVPGFVEYDRHMKPDVKYVVARIGDEPIPVTAVSVNNARQWVKPGRIRTNYFSYKSMINALKMQRPMMHCSITAALSNGGVYHFNPKHSRDIGQRNVQVRRVVKNRHWEPFVDADIHGYGFKHEGVILCLRRCQFADDMMLSVSMSSFCVWKEQSILYKERKKKMPWLKSWYSDEVHNLGSSVDILPIFWKRNYRTHTEYVSGNWSSHNVAAVYLMTSDGFVEVWDLRNEDKYPSWTMRTGVDTVHHAYPLTFSTRDDQVAFVEDELLYFTKIPDGWKTQEISARKYLQKTGSHEIWRRAQYYAWNKRFEQDHKEEIEHRKRRFYEICEADRLGRMYRDYTRNIYMRAYQAKKMHNVLHWCDKYPLKWWQTEYKRKTAFYLRKKKMPLKWIVERDRIPVMLQRKIFAEYILPKEEMQIITGCRVDRKLQMIIREYFQLFWEIRYKVGSHIFFFYKENELVDKALVRLADMQHVEEMRTRQRRISEYNLHCNVIDSYSIKRYLYMYYMTSKSKLSVATTYLQQKCKTKFSMDIDPLYKSILPNKMSPGFSKSETPLETSMDRINNYFVRFGIIPLLSIKKRQQFGITKRRNAIISDN